MLVPKIGSGIRAFSVLWERRDVAVNLPQNQTYWDLHLYLHKLLIIQKSLSLLKNRTMRLKGIFDQAGLFQILPFSLHTLMNENFEA